MPPRRRERWRPGPAPLGEQRRRSIARAPRPPPGHPERRRPRPRSARAGHAPPGPSSSMSPRTASRRPLPTGVSARKARAAETDTGEALYVSSTSVAPPGSSSIAIRCGRTAAGLQGGRDFGQRNGEVLRHRRRGKRVRDEMTPRRRAPDPPFAPRRAEREAHPLQALGNDVGGPDVGTSPRPNVRTAAGVTAAIAATRGSSAFSTASPSAGRPGEAPTWPPRSAPGYRPARDGWDGPRARPRPRAG